MPILLAVSVSVVALWCVGLLFAVALCRAVARHDLGEALRSSSIVRPGAVAALNFRRDGAE